MAKFETKIKEWVRQNLGSTYEYAGGTEKIPGSGIVDIKVRVSNSITAAKYCLKMGEAGNVQILY